MAASPSIGGANAKSPARWPGLANRESDFLEGAKRKEPKPGGRALATAGAKRKVCAGEGEAEWIAQRPLGEGGRCGRERPAGMGDGRQAKRKGAGRWKGAVTAEDVRVEKRLAGGREGAPSHKGVGS